MARFELCLRLCEKELNSTELLGDTTELFIEYFRKFGHKPCCVSDLRSYLNLLDAEKKTELSSRLVKDVGISSTSVPQTVSRCKFFIIYIFIALYFPFSRCIQLNFKKFHFKQFLT